MYGILRNENTACITIYVNGKSSFDIFVQYNFVGDQVELTQTLICISEAIIRKLTHGI